MALRKLVEGGIDNLHILAEYRFFYICNLLRTLVNQKDDQVHVRVVGGNRLGNLLEQGCLTCLWRGYYKAALAFSDRRQQIQHPHGGAADPPGRLHMKPLVWKDRGQVFEIRPLLQHRRRHAIYGTNI